MEEPSARVSARKQSDSRTVSLPVGNMYHGKLSALVYTLEGLQQMYLSARRVYMTNQLGLPVMKVHLLSHVKYIDCEETLLSCLG